MIAGRRFHVVDVAMALAALGWLIFAIAISAQGQKVAGDDAFISFQYARNLARGYGFVFNQGERVWGFTSPLQTLELGFLTTLGYETARAAFVAAFLWIAVAAVLLYGLGARLLPRPLALCLGLFFLLDRTEHGSLGLEGNLLIAVQLAFLLAATADRGRLANILGALACLVRPDSLLLVLPIVVVGRETRKLENLIWFAGIGVAWEGFALLYFGELVPNSYHAKSGLSQFVPFFADAFNAMTGFSFAWRWGLAGDPSMASRVVLVLLGGLALVNPNVRRRFAPAYTLLLYPWLLVGAYAWIGSVTGHHWEFYSARFFLRVSAAIGLLSLGNRLAERWPVRPALQRSAVAALLLFTLVSGGFRAAAMVKEFSTKDASYWGGARYDTYRRIADWMNANLPQGATVAIMEVGTIAYFTDVKVIDVAGIVTRGYAPDERKNYARFMLRFSPTYAMVYGNVPEMQPSASMYYRRIAYFSKQGFEDFSILEIGAP